MFISEDIEPRTGSRSGRGVFAKCDIPKDTCIEISPVVVLPKKNNDSILDTELSNYVFEWGNTGRFCMALGYVAVYNHDYSSNCEYQMDFKGKTMRIITVRNIKAGEELFVNYNGSPNSKRKVWFDK